MAFTPKTWHGKPNTSTPITAAELNRIEQGIAAAATQEAVDALPIGDPDPTAVRSVAVVTGTEARPTAPVVLWLGGSTRPANMTGGDLWFADAPGDVPAVPIPTPVSRHAFSRSDEGLPAVSDPGGYPLWPIPAAGSNAIPGVASTMFSGTIGPGALSKWSLAVDFWINGPLADAGTFWTLLKVTDSHFFEMNGLGVCDAYLGGGSPATSSVAATVGAWHRLVVTYDSATERTLMYLDGVQVADRTDTNTTNPNWGGTSQVCTDGFSGRVDNITLWQDILTAQQVTALGTAG